MDREYAGALLGHGPQLQHDERKHLHQSLRMHLDALDHEQLCRDPLLCRLLRLEWGFEL